MNGGSAAAASSGLAAAPLLGPADIRQALERLFAKERHSYLVVLFGRGEGCQVAAAGRSFTVVPTRCELELRAAMPPPGEEQRANKVFLVDWTDQPLPLDIQCRLAGRKMHFVSRDARLAVLFGARTGDPGLEGTALASVLLSGAVPNLKKVSGQVLRRAEAYRRFLNARFDYPLDEEVTPARHLCFCAASTAGPSLVREAERDPTWARLRDELRSFVAGETRLLGEAAWLAWEAGEGTAFIEVCLLLEGLLPELGQGTYADGLLRGQVRSLAPTWGEALLGQASALADPALMDEVLAGLEGKGPGLSTRELVGRADERAQDPELRKALARSRRLAVGYQTRRDALALALQRQAEAPSPDRARAAADALLDLQSHRLTREEARATREQRSMVVRLAAYLSSRTREGVGPGGADFQEAIELAETYAREGGYVDWARSHVRSWTEGPLGQATQAVLSRVDELRIDDDRRFAEGLMRWLAAGEPATQVVPIAQALQRVVSEYLGEKEHRKVLVLLMDGMSWANAVELVTSLEEEHWEPARWRPKAHRHRPAGVLPPILAALPTLTHVSRAAFFAGKKVAETSEETTALDPKRWAQNREVKSRAGEEVPELLLKDQILDQGRLHQRAKDLVASDDPLVGLVLNAIDDQLKAGQQMRAACTAGEIKPLKELLDLAEGAGRAVLLLADHGHVPGDLLVSRGAKEEGGQRWRPLGAGEEPEPFEVRLPKKGTWRPRRSEGVAAIWDPRVCYGNAHYGEHGGVSLAEVVAPAILIVPETLAAARPGELDEGAAGIRLVQPDWWQIDATRRVVRREPQPREQLQIPGTAPAKKPALSAGASAPEAVPPLVAALQSSKVFKEHTRGLPAPRVAEALRHLAAVVAAGDQISEGELARRCGVQDFRVTGLVVRLGEVLNHEGYTVVEHDRNGQQVRLNRARLIQLFEVKM